MTLCRFVHPWHAIVSAAGLTAAAANALVVCDVVHGEKVQLAVIVVVEPDGAHKPSGEAGSGFFGHIGKGAVAIVVIKRIAAVRGDVNVGPAIAVVIADGNTHAERLGVSDPSLFGDVGESAVVVVVVERVPQRLLWREEVGRAAVDDKDVHPAVVVVVEEGASRADRFGIVALVRLRVVVNPGDAACLGRDFLKDDARVL